MDGFYKNSGFWRDENHVYRVVMSNDTATIPQEVLTTEGTLYFGIFGVNGMGQLMGGSEAGQEVVSG